MAEETQYTLNTAIAIINTANPNLDGTGTMSNVITAAANGTFIKTVSIKAQSTTVAMGMIRLFIYDGTNTSLLKEIPVFNTVQSAINPTFQTSVALNFALKPGYILKASTQNAETYNIIAEASDLSYYGGAVREDTTQYFFPYGYNKVSTANSNLDGTGATSGFWDEGSINSITIKALGNVTDGMIRFFLQGTTTFFLFFEVPVNTTSNSGTSASFEKTIIFENGWDSSYSLYASTQNGEAFSIVAEGKSWSYPS